MDGGTWWAIVHGVAKSRTRLSDFTFIFLGTPSYLTCLSFLKDDKDKTFGDITNEPHPKVYNHLCWEGYF